MPHKNNSYENEGMFRHLLFPPQLNVFLIDPPSGSLLIDSDLLEARDAGHTGACRACACVCCFRGGRGEEEGADVARRA